MDDEQLTGKLTEQLRKTIAAGEGIAVEFKRCGDGVGADTFETVCAFLNRFGGDIILGVDDNGDVTGVPEYAAKDICKNFVKMVCNPDVINPTAPLSPEIVRYEGKQIIYVHVPPSSEVHTYKKTIYDRNGDADIKVTGTGKIMQMCIRKQKIHTERQVYKYITDGDLRLDMMSELVQRAVNHHRGQHPWQKMTTKEILQSSRLIMQDPESGIVGYNLAAVVLLGRDEVIKDVCPYYRTDALLRKVNIDRYDDRLLVESNLIESYDLLMGFATKHLWDKFHLEDTMRVSLRDKIAREMIVNTLIHREFTSSYRASFIIMRDKMYTENANRAEGCDAITPVNLFPESKNPTIAAFMRNAGYADEMGTGTRNLFHYVRLYSGKYPEMLDGDVFRTIVPLDDEYSFDAGIAREARKLEVMERSSEEFVKAQNKAQAGDESIEAQTGDKPTKAQNKAQNKAQAGCGSGNNQSSTESAVLDYLRDNPWATQTDAAAAIGKSRRAVQDAVAALKAKGMLEREGAKKNGRWVVTQLRRVGEADVPYKRSN
jgi:ATP-dependent DNA helicase RecG